MLKLIHFYSSINTLGGVESLLKHHANSDEMYGIESIVLLGCEREKGLSELSGSKVHTLGVRGWNTVGQMRRRFSKFISTFDPDVIVYHNLWAFRHLADIASGALQVGMLHTDSPVSRNALKKCATILDGLICVSPPIADFATKYIEKKRIFTINYPIDPPNQISPIHSGLKGREIVIGFSGRLVIEQKRVDRLESICSFLQKSEIAFRLEILGEGAEMDKLKSELVGKYNVVFLGKKHGKDYWNTIRVWDFILFCSDYEGTPISMLECLSLGVIPIYPTIQSGGDLYVRNIDEKMLYNAIDLSGPSTIIRNIISENPVIISEIRRRCSRSVRKNSLENYFSDFFMGVKNFQNIKQNITIKNDRYFFDSALPMYAIRRFSPNLIY